MLIDQHVDRRQKEAQVWYLAAYAVVNFCVVSEQSIVIHYHQKKLGLRLTDHALWYSKYTCTQRLYQTMHNVLQGDNYFRSRFFLTLLTDVGVLLLQWHEPRKIGRPTNKNYIST
jgi:hypothetical protein